MQAMRATVLIGLVLMTGPARGGETLQLGRNPGECEISAALGIVKEGCAPVVQRAPAEHQAEPPPPAPAPEPVPVVVVAPPPPPVFTAAFEISFEFGSARISRASAKLLGRIATVLASPEAATVRFRIVGHTDGVGRPEDNLRLSLQRATAVRDYLVKQARMDAGRFEVAGRGATELLNKTNPAAAENRRVEIANLGGGTGK